MTTNSVDAAREGVLRKMEHQASMIRFALVGAMGVEALMLLVALRLIDWHDKTHILIFVTAILGYTIIALGLAALGAHVSRVSNRVVAVLETMAPH
jgi:hypothetical protein